MTQQLCERPAPVHEEDGVIIIMTVFLIVALLALGGLAVDSGNLYQRKLQLQKAVDAGALAGIGNLIIEGRDEIEKKFATDETLKDYVEAQGKSVARENLRIAGVPLEKIKSLTAEYRAGDNALQVSASLEVDLLLMDRVPFQIFYVEKVKGEVLLDATATSQRSRANVSLIVDTSNSMNCPTEGSCECLSPAGLGLCGGKRRIDQLKEALRIFAEQFDPTRDRINFVPFNIAAKLALGVQASGGFSLDNLKNEIGKLAPKSLTNICDGLMRGYADLKQAAVIDQEEVAYVLFSDGAPTAGRFLLSAPGSVPANDPQKVGAYDYLHYGVRWVQGVTQSVGPSPLVKTGKLPFDHNSPVPPVAGVPACSAKTGPSDPAQYREVFTSCNVPNLGFHMPNEPATAYASNYDGVYDGLGVYIGSGKPYDLFWREQYFNCAIQLSDHFRSHLGIVFGIGLGDSVAAGEEEKAAGADPYQDVGDERILRKDVFMARVANDYLEGVRYPFERFGAAYPEFTYTNYKPYAALHSQGDPREGRYYPTPRAEDLEKIFRDVARRIQLRLIQ